EKVLAEIVRERPPRMRSVASDDYVEAFREQMMIYRSYWSDDPEFDSTATQAALPHLPCPKIDRNVMDRLVRYAIDTNFGWPREAPIPAGYDAGAIVDRAGGNTAQNTDARVLNLSVAGPGGGQWHLTIAGGAVATVDRGLADGAAATCY